jgi:RHS repeat-associated protein
LIAYFPCGGTHATSGGLNTDKRFTGQRLDQDGLYYYGARYYDATIGRFISADNLVPDSKNPQSLNRYSYCWNNPLKYVDPTGHWGWSSIKKAAKAVAKAVVKNIDYVQTAIDIAGLIPVVGEAFDAANAVIYAARGDYVSAGLSLAACIPVAGMAATAGKLAKTAVKVVDKAQALKKVTKAVDTATAAKRSIVIGENMKRVRTAAKKLGADVFEGRGRAENLAWIREAKARGDTIYDIGPDFPRRLERFMQGKRPDSIWYNLERQETTGYPLVKLFDRLGKFWGISVF